MIAHGKIKSNSDVEGWNKIAQEYSAWLNGGSGIRGEAFTTIVTENIVRLIGAVNGKTLLDLGCGDGYVSRKLSLSGAKVDAIDGAQKMIEIARRSSHGDICFKVGDITETLPYKDEKFDIVLCNMVLMDIEEVKPVFENVKRILKTGGKFVFSVVHPCFFDALGEWVDTNTQSPALKFMNRYTEQFKYMKRLDGLGTDSKVAHYNRPIQDYVNPLITNGFRIVDFLETSFSEEYLENIGMLNEFRRYHLTANNLIIGAQKT